MNGKTILHNVRVLDFTWVLAGPFATRMLADFGAEVIKVQPMLPPDVDDKFGFGYYNIWNRNKMGISLNLGKTEGISLAKKLVGISDIVVDNFTPRVMANFGLDYDNLKKINPNIIMLSMSVMGQTGPWRDYSGFAPAVHAFSGITHLTSGSDGKPVGLGFSYSDHIAGLYASLALLSALEHKKKTGEGQYIDLSQVEAMSSLLGSDILKYGISRGKTKKTGNSSSVAAPDNVYQCCGTDRWCAINVNSDEEWGKFKDALNNPPWADDEKFETMAGRLKNSDELDNLVESWTKQQDAEKVMTILQEEGIAAGIVQNAEDLLKDKQLMERNFFVNLPHPETGEIITDANPVKMSRTPAEYKRAAPLPGQDNRYVYGKLIGMTEAEVAELERNGVI